MLAEVTEVEPLLLQLHDVLHSQHGLPHLLGGLVLELAEHLAHLVVAVQALVQLDYLGQQGLINSAGRQPPLEDLQGLLQVPALLLQFGPLVPAHVRDGLQFAHLAEVIPCLK